MSLILDALKRAERDHPRDLAQRVGSGGWPRPPRRAHTGWLAGIALVVALVAAAWWATRGPQPAPTGQAAVQTPVQPPVQTEPERERPAAPQHSALDAIDPVPVVTPEQAPAAREPVTDALFLQELPEELRSNIPSLTVNAHVWSEDPQRRMVMINMRNYSEGDQITQGLKLLRILPDGAELAWHGERFRIAAR